jgi:hypothetical protein
VQLAGSAIFASGRGGKGLLVSITKGESWRAVKAADEEDAHRSASFSGDVTHAFGLAAAGSVQRQLFFTASGGDAGSPSLLTLKALPKSFTRATLRKAKGKVTISGKLAGAVGGERVTVSARAITGTDWTSRTVTAGANGGSFSATFTIKHAAVFVGQWAGDSGRAGVGSKPLLVRVR